MTDLTNLCARLRATKRYETAFSAKVFDNPINPDGPEAAEVIETLADALKMVVEALKPFVDTVDWEHYEHPDEGLPPDESETDWLIKFGLFRRARTALTGETA